MHKLKKLTFVLSLIVLSACGASTHSIIASSESSLRISYDAYGMMPTLTDEAQDIAHRHCAKFYRDAICMGAQIPNAMSTKEWHEFQCVEKNINVSEVSLELDNAMSASEKKLGIYLDYIRGNIVALDDLSSDALTIGIATADVGSRYHRDYVNNLMSKLQYSERVKSIIRDTIYETAGTKVIPYVLNWRKIVKTGYGQNKATSQSELPDKLYSAGVKVSI